ncbi:MAG: response regulator [Planctomycetes bacterium]|nr:response regulator [Planctomycetota bacterium]
MKDGKYLILCIDDDLDILDNLELVLEANGYEVARARTGEEGLKSYKQQEPDLIIVDLMMEEVDAGTSFVKELKAMGSKVPIYMLSSVGDHLNQSADYSALGLTGVIQKPIAPETLLKILRTKLK